MGLVKLLRSMHKKLILLLCCMILDKCIPILPTWDHNLLDSTWDHNLLDPVPFKRKKICSHRLNYSESAVEELVNDQLKYTLLFYSNGTVSRLLIQIRVRYSMLKLKEK